jgi:hypothetical protein
MPGDVSVDLDLLEEAFTVLLARLRAENGTTFSLDRDYFWSISPYEVFDVEARPGDLGIGQVTECLDWLAQLRTDRETALPFHLVWLAEILRAVGTRAGPNFGGERGCNPPSILPSS